MTAGSATKPTRRSPVTRDEGRRRLIEATVELCQERPFADVPVREIGRRADVNHGFVHTWFGGKAGLAAAVCDHLVEQVTARVADGRFPADMLRSPEVVLLVRLNAWLQSDESAKGLAAARGMPFMEFGRTLFEEVYGFDAETAATLADIVGATVVGAILMGDGLQVDTTRMAELWQEMLRALTAARAITAE